MDELFSVVNKLLIKAQRSRVINFNKCIKHVLKRMLNNQQCKEKAEHKITLRQNLKWKTQIAEEQRRMKENAFSCENTVRVLK